VVDSATKGERVTKEPKNHTTVMCASWDIVRGYESSEAKTLYADVHDPLSLPLPALCLDTIQEWREWWHWHIDELADKAMVEEQQKLNKQFAGAMYRFMGGDKS